MCCGFRLIQFCIILCSNYAFKTVIQVISYYSYLHVINMNRSELVGPRMSALQVFGAVQYFLLYYLIHV